MEARESRHRCLIDDGEARLQWQVAQEELEHAPGVASCASPHDGLPPDHEFENTALLARLIRLTRRLHSRTHKELVRATVKVAMDEEHEREQGSVFQPNGSARGGGGGNKFPSHPLVTESQRRVIEAVASARAPSVYSC